MNCELSNLAWIQAGLPAIRDGGLCVQSVVLLAPPAFLALAAATLDLQDAVLSEVELEFDSFVPRVTARWSEMFESESLSGSAARSQRSWEAAAINHGKTTLIVQNMNPIDRARLLALFAPHSGDWLMALPVASRCLRLDNESIREAVGLRLGCIPFALHIAVYVAPLQAIESTGSHVGWRLVGWFATMQSTTSYIGRLAEPSFHPSWNRGA